MEYLPDTSVIVDGRFTKFIKKLKSEDRIIFSEEMLSEIEHQANENRSTGFAALDELKKIKKIAGEKGIEILFMGKRPSEWQMKNGKSGEIDNIIRNLAWESNAVLVTGDRIQKDIAEIKGIRSEYLPAQQENASNIEDFFEENTISVHIKAGTNVRRKDGLPGEVKVIKTERIVNEIEASAIANNIIRRAGNEPNSFIEMDMAGATVVQLNLFRIVISRAPFSKGTEITAVRPIKKTEIEDYDLDPAIIEHMKNGSSGVIVAGAPGAGKSTFVQAMANFLSRNGMIVKTMERPRDLQVDSEITQYTGLEGSMEKTGDILLLVRNDYTIFDEMRVTSDFKVYADLRLAGVGMIGVVHATRAIDALQRFIGRIELGMIPQVVDTILFIKNGAVEKILKIEQKVKVPEGMVQDDLARPVIVVTDFSSNTPLYEAYTFGEQIVVVPVQGSSEDGIDRGQKVRDYISRHLNTDDIDVTMHGKRRAKVTVPESLRPKLIGKRGSNISEIEKSLGISIDVDTLADGRKRDVHIEAKNKILYLYCGVENSLVNIYVDDMMILQGRTSSKGIIRIKIDSENGQNIQKAMKSGKKISFSEIVE